MRGGIWLGGLAAAVLCCEAAAATTSWRAKFPSQSSLSGMTSPAGPASGEARLNALGRGLALSWIEGSGNTRRLRMSIWEGKSWGKPSTIVQGKALLANWADFPTVMQMNGGPLLAAWPWSTGPESYEIRISLSSDQGKTWSAPRRLHRDASKGEHGFASFASYQNGAQAFWLQPGAGKGTALHTAFVLPDGSVVGEREIDGHVCDCCQTSAVVTDKEPMVAYRDRSQSEVRDISVWRNDGTNPRGVHADGWKIQGCPVNGPAIAAIEAGGTAIAWFTAAADSPRVFVAFSDDNGESYSAPLRIDTGRPQGRVSVLWVNHLWALVTWVETLDDSTASFSARLVGYKVQLGPPFSIAKMSAKRASGVPQVGRSGNLFLFAWKELGSSPGIRMASMEIEPRDIMSGPTWRRSRPPDAPAPKPAPEPTNPPHKP